MSDDPFQVFVDELTALRRSVEHLARTSLSKQEAESLHVVVADAVDRMAGAAEGAPEALRSALAADRDQMLREASEAASRAAQEAVEGVRGELEVERRSYAESLSEARRAARRERLRSWPVVVALLASGAVLGLLGAYGTETAKSVLTVEQEIRYGCGITVGQVVERDDGSSYCATWIVTPEEAERRRGLGG